MLNVTKELKGKTLFVRLEGAIEESTNFDGLIGLDATEMVIQCRQIPLINSVGVKSWIDFFSRCDAKGIQLKFVECSPMIVQQINAISNFIYGVVESIMVPFSCDKCDAEDQQVFTVASLAAAGFNPPPPQCKKCAVPMTFDDEPDEYFGCFKKR